MAKSWSGFMPQNAVAKEQWSLLEASRAEVEQYLDIVREFAQGNSEDQEACALALALEDAGEA